MIIHLSPTELRNNLDMLEGNIARIAVSDDPSEIINHMSVAIDRIVNITSTRVTDLLQKDTKNGNF